MKNIITILIILLVALGVRVQVCGQQLDMVLQQKLNKADSVHLKIDATTNKLKTKLQGKTPQHQLDSLQKKLSGKRHNASEIDSVNRKDDAGVDAIRRRAQLAEHKYDSIRQRLNSSSQNSVPGTGAAQQTVEKVESHLRAVQHPLDSMGQKLTMKVEQKLSFVDSTAQKVSQVQGKVEHTEQKYVDSLTIALKKYEQKLHVTKLTNTVDSLKESALPYEKYKHKLDSLESINPLQKAQAGATQVQTRIQGVADKPKAAIDEKLKLLSKESGGKGNVPGGIVVPQANVNGLSDKLTGDVKLPAVKIDIDPKLPSLDQSQLKTPDQSLTKDITKKLSTPDGIDKTSDLSKLNDLKKGTKEVTQVSGKVTGYTNDVKNIANGDVEKVKTLKEDAIAKLPVKDELSEIQKQDRLIKEQAAKLQSFKNPEEFKKQTIARSNEVIAQQMAVYNKQIQDVVDKVSKSQSKLGTVMGYSKDLPKQRDRLQKLKMYEKFVPGITLQILKPGGAWIVDLNPALRYRLTSYWSVGAGWNERALFGKYSKPYEQVRIYGPRSFTEVVLFRGLSFRIDAEDMNIMIAPDPQNQDANRRLWIWSYMAGMKKDFSFVPGVIGNVQFMYKVYSSNSNNPYLSAFNVRFGFEYLAKKKANRNK